MRRHDVVRSEDFHIHKERQLPAAESHRAASGYSRTRHRLVDYELQILKCRVLSTLNNELSNEKHRSKYIKTLKTQMLKSQHFHFNISKMSNARLFYLRCTSSATGLQPVRHREAARDTVDAWASGLLPWFQPAQPGLAIQAPAELARERSAEQSRAHAQPQPRAHGSIPHAEPAPSDTHQAIRWASLFISHEDDMVLSFCYLYVNKRSCWK